MVNTDRAVGPAASTEHGRGSGSSGTRHEPERCQVDTVAGQDPRVSPLRDAIQRELSPRKLECLLNGRPITKRRIQLRRERDRSGIGDFIGHSDHAVDVVGNDSSLPLRKTRIEDNAANAHVASKNPEHVSDCFSRYNMGRAVIAFQQELAGGGSVATEVEDRWLELLDLLDQLAAA